MNQTQNETGSQAVPMSVPPYFDIHFKVDAGGFEALRSALGTLPYNASAKLIEYVENQVREQIVAHNEPKTGEANTEVSGIGDIYSDPRDAAAAYRAAARRDAAKRSAKPARARKSVIQAGKPGVK